MELSIRDAKARFTEAAAAAARGERVIVTKHGAPFVELVPARKRKLDFDAADQYLRDVGWKPTGDLWPEHFDDPAFSRFVLGLDEEDG